MPRTEFGPAGPPGKGSFAPPAIWSAEALAHTGVDLPESSNAIAPAQVTLGSAGGGVAASNLSAVSGGESLEGGEGRRKKDVKGSATSSAGVLISLRSFR